MKELNYLSVYHLLLVAVLIVGAASRMTSVAAPPRDPAWTYSRILRGDVDLPAEAQRLTKQGKYGAAAKVFAKMQRRATNTESRVYALTQRANCLFEAGKYYDAFTAYEQLGENFPQQADYQMINNRLRHIAEAYVAGNVSFLGGPNLEQAREIYKVILVFSPAGKQAAADTMRLAELQDKSKLRDKALVTYQEVLRKFPETEQAPYARLAVAELYISKAQETRNRWEPARRARQIIAYYLDQYPEHPGRQRGLAIARAADEEVADDLLYLGRFYCRPAHYRPDVARRYLSDLIREYSDTNAAAEARTLLAQIEGDPGAAGDEAAAPVTPPSEEMTPNELLKTRRRLPEPAEAAENAAEQKQEPDASRLIEESRRVKKWLLPIPDLGIDSGA